MNIFRQVIILTAVAFGVTAFAEPGFAAQEIDSELKHKLESGIDTEKLLNLFAKGKKQRFLVTLKDNNLQIQSALQKKGTRQERINALKEHSAAVRDRFRNSLNSSSKKFYRNGNVREFSHLPAVALNIDSVAGLNLLLKSDYVKGIHKEKFFYLTLSQSLPLISQPFVESRGAGGEDTTVVIIDSGINYTHSAFGSCSAPGVPAETCSVVYSADIAPDDGSLDDSGHGTNVSGIVIGTAPKTKLAVLDIFNGQSASSIDLVSAINWAISNQEEHNIVAMNLSLGDSSSHSEYCEDYFKTYFMYARNAGILAAVSSGNDGHSNGVNSPACNSNVIAVGAVYDANVGGISYSGCSDSSSSADKIACFSNSGEPLDILAPGALITAGGYTMAGTSMAAPHVAGAIAVVRSQFAAPEYSVADIESMLKNSGVSITDSRNGITRNRLDLKEILAPGGSGFATAIVISTQSGNNSGNNQFAYKEDSEPDHAGNSGGSSVWLEWQAPADGIYTFDSFGSDFDTLLAAYSGSDIANLTEISSCDDELPQTGCRISIQAGAGETLRIALDGKDGATGNYQINWNYSPLPEEEEIPFLPPVGYLIFSAILLIGGWRKSR